MPGIAALERAVDAGDDAGGLRDTLETVAARAKNKSVAKRARGMMQALDEAEAAKRLALETWQQKVASLVARVETLAPHSAHAAAELESTEAEWAALATEPAFELDPNAVARFEAAAGAVRAALAEQQRLEAERRAEDERRAARRASRAALIERVDTLRGEDALEQLARATEEWAALDASAGDADAARCSARSTPRPPASGSATRTGSTCTRRSRAWQEIAGDAERLSGEEPLQRERVERRRRRVGRPGAALGGPGRSRSRALRTGTGSRARRRTRSARRPPSEPSGSTCSASSS